MDEWSSGAKAALLRHLAETIEQAPPAAVSTLWRLHKDARHLRCVVQYLSTGIDVRLLEADHFRRTQLCQSAPEANTLAEEWRLALVERGWLPHE